MLDGDGALLMHLGSMGSVGKHAPQNFKHVLINNGCHDSVGGQPTGAFDVDFCKIARSCGYNYAHSVSKPQEIAEYFAELRQVSSHQI